MERYEGFAEFVAARGPALSRTAYLLMGDHFAAADLVQAALEKTATHWQRVIGSGDPDAYVRRVMVNQRTSWWRRHRGAELSGEVPEQAADDGIGRALDRITLRAALATLGPRQRAIVVLRFYEDYSVTQTAQALGCSEGTVKSQTHAALARLRRALLAETPTGVDGTDVAGVTAHQANESECTP